MFQDKREFFSRRLGLFVHWGLYSIPGWQEQHQLRLKIPRAEYARLQNEFNPAAFNPHDWIDLAQTAGMTYLIFTTKHLDGFCLWKTQTTDFNAAQSPFGRDALKELAEACEQRNFPLGIYFSAIDHHCPNYPNRGIGHELAKPEPGDHPDWEAFCDYTEAQIRELCTNYGKFVAFWWDSGPEIGFKCPRLNRLIRELQPEIMINNRGLSDDGDFSTPERDFHPEFNKQASFQNPTEACQSIGVESWGWREEEDYFSDQHLLAEIDRALAKNGNYLLNVGPRPDGSIPEQARQILKAIGDWRKAVGDSFVDTETSTNFKTTPDAIVTRRGNTLFLHFPGNLASNRILLHGIGTPPNEAILLNTGDSIRCSTAPLPWHLKEQGNLLRFCELPVNNLTGTVPVLRLNFPEGTLPPQ